MLSDIIKLYIIIRFGILLHQTARKGNCEMRTKVPHNVLTISEMTKRPNRINLEVIDLNAIILTDEMIKKLRASSSMFNKTTYVQILHDGIKYNVESVDRQRGGKYKILLISTTAYATAVGMTGEHIDIVKQGVL